MLISAHLAPALLASSVALHLGSIDDANGDDVGFTKYDDRVGYFDISEAIPESLERIQIGNGQRSPWKSVAPGGINSIGQYFHSRTLLSTALGYGPEILKFNPSLIVLPEAIAKRFGPDAYYLAAIRQSNGQCSRLGGRNWTASLPRLQGYTTVAVLRENFSALGTAGIRGWDCRLYADGDQLYITRMFTSDWGVSEMQMDAIRVSPAGDWSGQGIRGVMVDFVRRLAMFGDKDRNLGVLKHNGKLMVLKDIADTVTVSRLRLKGQTDADSALHLHNNINPLELPERNAFLGVAHVHLNDNCTAPECSSTVGPKYGNTYVSMFFLFDRGSPWAARRISPPFCIPSTMDSSRCETIQFITSVVRQGSELLVTYGINDCEAAAVLVPLLRVLEFLDNGSAPVAQSRAGVGLFPITIAP